MRLIGILFFFFTACILQADLLISGINFGDSRDEVTKKLRNSKLVKFDVPEVMLTRVELNGSFKTLNNLKGKQFLLYFNWSDADSLDQLTFISTAFSKASYDTQLKSSWNSAIQLISSIHGKTDKTGDYPNGNKLQDCGILYSHEWVVNDDYVYLGIGKENGQIHLIIPFLRTS